MINPIRPEEISVFRRFAPKIGLKFGFGAAVIFAILPTGARAQVNIDQGKPPAEIFQNDCATCHKTTRGLADGKNSLMLSAFLREHYTASGAQAAALAAYVLGGGGGAPAQKPAQEHAKATGEEPKSGEPKTAEPKTATRPEQEVKPAEQDQPAAEPSPAAAQKPNTGKREARPVTASRGHKPEPEAATPPTVGAAATNSAAAPAESQPSENAAVPRDNIPD
jgi:hypothetical protein